MKYLLFAVLFAFLFLSEVAQGQLTESHAVLNSSDFDTAYKSIDINGDGRLDLFADRDNRFQAFLNLEDYVFSSTGVFNFDTGPFNYEIGNFEFIDIDGDGDQDLINVFRDLIWYENIDGTSFVYQDILLSEFGGFGNAKLTVADFDGDGDEDFVMHESFAFDLDLIYFENNDGSFMTRTIFQDSDLSFSQILSIDINQDGQLDIVGKSDNDLYVYYKNGSGFDLNPSIFQGPGNTRLHLNDMNQDGQADLTYQFGNCLKVQIIANNTIDMAYDFYCGSTGDNAFIL